MGPSTVNKAICAVALLVAMQVAAANGDWSRETYNGKFLMKILYFSLSCSNTTY